MLKKEEIALSNYKQDNPIWMSKKSLFLTLLEKISRFGTYSILLATLEKFSKESLAYTRIG